MLFPTPTAKVGSPPNVPPPQTPPWSQPPLSSRPHRPLRREGAVIFDHLTQAEQAMEDAMLRSSSPAPEPVLGKRTCEEDEQTEPDEDATSTPRQSQLPPPSISNVIASTLQYALKKKLRPEQHDEMDAFLLVSSFIITLPALVSEHWSGHDTWSAG